MRLKPDRSDSRSRTAGSPPSSIVRTRKTALAVSGVRTGCPTGIPATPVGFCGASRFDALSVRLVAPRTFGPALAFDDGVVAQKVEEDALGLHVYGHGCQRKPVDPDFRTPAAPVIPAGPFAATNSSSADVSLGWRHGASSLWINHKWGRAPHPGEDRRQGP